MIVTNYGLDNALCQVIYKRMTNRDDYMTVSPRNINDFLKAYRPNVLIGFNNISVKFLKENDMVIIDNTKRAIETYNDYPKFVGGLKLSKTKIFNDLLSKKLKTTSELKYIALASKVAAYDYDENCVSILELYDTIGHDQFVSRLLANGDLVLSPKEQELVSRMKNHKELIIYHSLDDIVLKDEDKGIYVARISYSMSRAYTDVLFSKYQDEVKLIVYWDYSPDGDIRVYMKSAQGDMASRIADTLGGYGYSVSGNFKLSIEGPDTSQRIMDLILTAIENPSNLKNIFNKHKEIENIETVLKEKEETKIINEIKPEEIEETEDSVEDLTAELSNNINALLKGF